MIEITVFRTQEVTKILRKNLLLIDNTFGPMGSGGYTVRSVAGNRSMLSFSELDTAPAENYKVGVKKNMVWAGRIAWFIRLFFINHGIIFSEEVKNFNNAEEIDHAFAQA